MRNKLLEQILNNKPDHKNLILSLRDKFIGSIVDESCLNSIGFNIITSPDNIRGNVWARDFNKHSYRVLLYVFKGLITNIKYSTNIDLTRDYGYNAPCGWFIADEISVIASNKILKDLSSIILEFASNNKQDNLKLYFNRIFANYKNEVIEEVMISRFIANCLIDNIENAAAILINHQYKFIDEIDDEDTLRDLPFFCGKIGFKDEFFEAIRRINELNIAMNDTSICNIGSVTCNKFNMYDLSIDLFIAALCINPKLIQAQQNIWIAGKYQIMEFLIKGDADNAIKTAQKIIKIAKKGKDHGFYSYVGLAYELKGNFGEAEIYYAQALKIDKNCDTSNIGIARISNDNYNGISISGTIAYQGKSQHHRELVQE